MEAAAVEGGDTTAGGAGDTSGGGAVSWRGSCAVMVANASKTWLQKPQRTCPPELCNCCVVTRKVVWHFGQQVNRFICARLGPPHTAHAHPAFPFGIGIQVEPLHVFGRNRVRLGLQDSGKHDVSSRDNQFGEQWR